jgi:DNA-binding transcriptional MerR regulator
MASRQTSIRRKRRRRNSQQTVLLSRTVLCTLSGISERQLSLWEHEDLLAPAQMIKVGGKVEPLYDRESVRRVRVIRSLEEELEVNLPGIGVILHLLDQMRH